MTATQTTPTRAAGRIICTSWCQDGDGHAAAVLAADQWCWGPAVRIELPPYRFPLTDPHTPGAIEDDTLDVFAARFPQDAGGFKHVVMLHHVALDDEIRLTRSQARELAANLLMAAAELPAEESPR